MRIKPREVALIRLPAPPEVIQVRPAVEQAILVAVDEGARLVGVLRQVRVRHPLTAEDVTLGGSVDAGKRLKGDVKLGEKLKGKVKFGEKLKGEA